MASLQTPHRVGEHLRGGVLWGVDDVVTASLCRGRAAAAVTLRFQPPVEAAAVDYPAERVRVVAFLGMTSTGEVRRDVLTYPQGPRRPYGSTATRTTRVPCACNTPAMTLRCCGSGSTGWPGS